MLHFCTGVVRKMNRKIWWVNATNYPFFVNNFWKREFVSKKVSFSTRLCKRGAFSHFLIKDCKVSQSKNHFGGKMKLFTHLFHCEASQCIRLECVKGPRFTDMWLLLNAAINVNRCISKYAF